MNPRPTPEEIAAILARKAALACPPDILEHPLPLPQRLDYAEAQIKRTIPIELYEELRQTAESFKLGIWSCCQDGEHSPERSWCIPGRQMKHVLDKLEKFLFEL